MPLGLRKEQTKHPKKFQLLSKIINNNNKIFHIVLNRLYTHQCHSRNEWMRKT